VLKQQVRAGDAGDGPPPACPREAELDEELRFLEKANLGGEFMKPEDQERVARIAQRQWRGTDGRMQPLLTEDEVRNLQITRGTLTEEERTLMNSHAVQTLTMLADLPFPAYLKAVPEYAGTHHEKMNGKGYPRGIFAGDLPMPARIIAVADIFESLTATDRPYKVPFRLSQTMEIMGKMKQSGELDPDVVDVLVRSGAYREYAKRFLPAELIDEVDGQAILAIKPQAPVLPPEEERRQRRTTLLPQFRPFVRERQTIGDWGGQSR